MNIEPQVILQPIDFSVPQSKAMLALYLVMPEIDNDLRSDKIKGGIRQALKNGRWTRRAPLGYANSRDENLKPILIPHQKNAPLIRYAFEEFSNGSSQAEIRMELEENQVCFCTGVQLYPLLLSWELKAFRYNLF